MNRWIVVFLVTSTITLGSRATATVAPSTAGAEMTRQVYISAIDASGAPVTDLTAGDIAVKEGKERTDHPGFYRRGPQYLLTYTLPDGVKPADRLSVSTSRKGVTLTAPSRVATK